MNHRKQELQHNELADWLEVKIDQIRPYFGMIGAGLLGTLLVIVGIIYWYQSSADATARSWAGHFDAADRALFDGSIEPLARHAAGDGNAVARSWSRQYSADAKLKEGLTALYRDRAKAEEALMEASKGFREVMDQNRPGTMIHDHAVFGNCLALEALGKTDEALVGYKSLFSENTDTAISRLAKRYHDRLTSVADAAEFMGRFVQHTPTPLGNSPFGEEGGFDPLGSGSGTGGLRSLPDLSFPEESATETPLPPGVNPPPTLPEGSPETPMPAGDGTTAEPTADEPEVPLTPATETPAGETPTTETPASETPAGEPAAPATETPATETPAGETPAPEVPATDPPSVPSN